MYINYSLFVSIIEEYRTACARELERKGVSIIVERNSHGLKAHQWMKLIRMNFFLFSQRDNSIKEILKHSSFLIYTFIPMNFLYK